MGHHTAPRGPIGGPTGSGLHEVVIAFYPFEHVRIETGTEALHLGHIHLG